VTPPPARYPSGQPTNPYLYDLRGHDYGVTGWIAGGGLAGAPAAGRVGGGEGPAIAAGLDHRGGVDRGQSGAAQLLAVPRHPVSLFAPSAYRVFSCWRWRGARLAQTRSGGALAYGAAALLVVLLMALNNLPVYLGLASLN